MDIQELTWQNNSDLTEHYAVVNTGRVVVEVTTHSVLVPQALGDPTWTENTVWDVHIRKADIHLRVLALAKAKVLSEDFIRSM